MEKTTTLNLRVNPTLKQDAETVLSKLGIPMSTAIDMFLNQIVLVGGIPFSVTVPKPPVEIDISNLSPEELYERLMLGYKDYKDGKTMSVKKATEQFSKKHFNEKI